MFHSVDFLPNGKRNSYTVEFLMNGHIEFGEVQYFLKCSLSCDNHSMCESSCQCKKSQHVAVLSLLERADHTVNLSKDRFSNATARHIIPIRKESGLSVAAAVADIVCICVSVNICDASDVAFGQCLLISSVMLISSVTLCNAMQCNTANRSCEFANIMTENEFPLVCRGVDSYLPRYFLALNCR